MLKSVDNNNQESNEGSQEPQTQQAVAQQPESILSSMTPEQLCGLTDGMMLEEVHAQLAMLYRRHNRAASSLNPQLRAEAEIMLNAIVDCRHRYLSEAS